MSELTRFIRYTLPGATCLLVIFTCALITDSSKTLGFLKTGSVGLSAALAGVAVALGYVLAQIYHFFFSIRPCDCVKLLHELEEGGVIKFVGVMDAPLSWNDVFPIAMHRRTVWTRITQVVCQETQRRRAWAIMNKIYYLEVGDSEVRERLGPWLDRLVDHTHSIGATLVGIPVAAIASFLVCRDLKGVGYSTKIAEFKLADFITDFGWAIVPLLLAIFLTLLYCRNYRSLQMTSNSGMLSVLQGRWRSMAEDGGISVSVRVHFHE